MYLNTPLLKFGPCTVLQVCYIMLSMNYMARRWDAFPMWHHSLNFSHVARDHCSTTASQLWKALISISNKMYKRFLCTFPSLLLPLSCSFFAILALRSSWSRSIAKSCEPVSSNHVVKWSQLLSSPMTYPASSCLRSCKPKWRGFEHCAWQRGADL